MNDFSVKFDFKLGQYVVDTASGVEGIINARVEWVSGNRQYSVQPISESGELKDAHWLDGDYFEPVGGKSLPSREGECPSYYADFELKLGDKVKSLYSPYQGYITGRVEWLNGCHRYQVSSKNLQDGYQIAQNYSLSEIKKLGKAIPPYALVTERADRLPGGPSSGNPSTKATF